jgi:hypothetical protein
MTRKFGEHQTEFQKVAGLIAIALPIALACSSNDTASKGQSTGDASAGGGSGGKGAGGSGAGGSAGKGTGGATTGGNPGTGGIGSGGTGVPLDAGCTGRQKLVYEAPGCGGSARAICEQLDACNEFCGPLGSSCAAVACACDDTTIGTDCMMFTKPYRHLGACTDGGGGAPLDAGSHD